jgi:hypothetical protein
MQADSVLTPGEWEALFYQAPDQVRPLVYRLAIHHGAIEQSKSADCLPCDQHGEQGVLKYGPVLPDGPEIEAEAQALCGGLSGRGC